MANSTITDLTRKSANFEDDYIEIVDTSDTTESPDGSSKKANILDIINGIDLSSKTDTGGSTLTTQEVVNTISAAANGVLQFETKALAVSYYTSNIPDDYIRFDVRDDGTNNGEYYFLAGATDNVQFIQAFIEIEPSGVIAGSDKVPTSGAVEIEVSIHAGKGFDEVGYTHKVTGEFVSSSSYRTTPFLRYLRGDLTVTGFSGNTNAVALVTFYDKDQNRISFKNETGASNIDSENYTILDSEIGSSAYFIKVSAASYQSKRKVYGNISIADEQIKELKEVGETNTTDIFDINNIANSNRNFSVSGFTSKANGLISASSSYFTTPYFRYISGDLTITGFSGNTNNAALLLMYDSNLVYLGYINEDGASNINSVDYVVSADDIDHRCVYVKVNANTSHANRQLRGNVVLFDPLLSEVIETVRPKNLFTLLNDRLKLTFLNYLGNDENIHPKVLYSKDGFFSSNNTFAMAYTPYPDGDTTAENPSIAYSRNGIDFITPNGLTNPITPQPVDGYNSDTHLVFREDTQVMECWYRPVVNGQDSIVRKVSTDLVNWSSEEIIIPEYARILSPAIIFENNKYTMFGVSLGVSPADVFRMISTDDTATAWETRTYLPINWGTLRPWHLDVIKTDLGYEYVIQAYELGNNNNSSDLYYVLEDLNGNFSEPKMIISRNDFTDWDDRGIYRSCILKEFGGYFVYFSAIKDNGQRSMGLMRGKDILKLE